MKKIRTKIAALICALVFAAVLFTACGTKPEAGPDANNSSTEQTQPEGSGNTDSDTDTDTPSAGQDPGGSGNTDSGNGTDGPSGGQTPDSGSGTEPALSREQYGQIYTNIGDTMLEAGVLKAMQPSAAARSLRALALTEDEIYTDENGDPQWVMLATAYIYLTAELYKNDSFVITEAPVALTCTYFSGETQADVTALGLSSSVNASTGKIVLKLDFTTQCYTASEPTPADELIQDENLLDTQHTFVYVSADYDLTADKLDDLLIHMWMYNTEELISSKYSSGSFRGMNENCRAQVTEEVLQLKQAFTDTLDGKIQLGDFSAEVKKANDYMLSKLMNG